MRKDLADDMQAEAQRLEALELAEGVEGLAAGVEGAAIVSPPARLFPTMRVKKRVHLQKMPHVKEDTLHHLAPTTPPGDQSSTQVYFSTYPQDGRNVY